jgi:hypothetical protein
MPKPPAPQRRPSLPTADTPRAGGTAPAAPTTGRRHPNLRPWRPGQSGNPKGRPPAPDLRATLYDALGSTRKDGRTALEAIVAALIARAERGDTRAAEALLDRAFGRPTQRADLAVDVSARVSPPIAWIDVPTVEPPR